MYDFHYNYMKAKYLHANHLRLLFTGTDSLSYTVQTNYIYKDMAPNRYDFSEYPLDHPLYDTSNRKVLDFFKDELNFIPRLEFVGLRPKCYAFHCTGEVKNNIVQHAKSTEKKTAKGVKWKGAGEHLHFHTT